MISIFVNAQLGWYVNGAGKIYKTTDGGETWLKQLEQPVPTFAASRLSMKTMALPKHWSRLLSQCHRYPTVV